MKSKAEIEAKKKELEKERFNYIQDNLYLLVHMKDVEIKILNWVLEGE